MLRSLFVLLSVVTLGLGAGSAVADERVTDHFVLASKQIPLPEGEWVLAGQDGAAPFASAVLVRLAGRDVQAFVIATTNTQQGATGWGLTRDCSRSDFAFAAIHYASAVDGACRFVNRVATNAAPGSSPAWIAATAAAVRQGWALPSQWLMAGVRVTDRRDVVDVRYHFLGGLPEKAAIWSEQALPAVERGLRNRLERGRSLPMPNLSITAARPRIAPPVVAAEAAGSSEWGIGLMKTLSWRVIGTAGDLAVAYLFTGDPVLSGGLAATGAVVNSVMYFGHELAWNQSGSPLVEFAGAGSFTGK